MEKPIIWLKRAKSNFIRGKDSSYLDLRDISLEDLCFDLQQCVEKSLKALLIYKNIDFPKTHNISKLLKFLIDNGLKLPEEIINASALTEYAINTRYSEDYYPITHKEYKEALEIAENVYNWVEEIITNQEKTK